MAEPRSYPSEASAERRVAQLRASGIWPGVVATGDGRFRLTWDPDLERPHRTVREE
jgi:hypothetical protein